MVSFCHDVFENNFQKIIFKYILKSIHNIFKNKILFENSDIIFFLFTLFSKYKSWNKLSKTHFQLKIFQTHF